MERVCAGFAAPWWIGRVCFGGARSKFFFAVGSLFWRNPHCLVRSKSGFYGAGLRRLALRLGGLGVCILRGLVPSFFGGWFSVLGNQHYLVRSKSGFY